MIRERLEQIARNRATMPVLLLLALSARCIRLDTQELGYDEMVAAFEANGLSVDRMSDGAAPFTWKDMRANDDPGHVVRSCVELDGGNGVLFALALHRWKDLFGNGTFAWRSLSVALGLALILLLHKAMLLLGGTPATALLAVALAALHSQFVDYSQEVRSYTLGILLVLATVVVAMLVANRARPRWHDGVLLGCLATGALFSHYFTAYVLVPFAAWYWLGRYARLSRFGTITAFLIPLVGLGTWAMYLGGEGLRTIMHRNHVIEDLVQTSGGTLIYPELSWSAMLKGLSFQFGSMSGMLAREGQAFELMALVLLPVVFVLGFLGVRHLQQGKLLLMLAMAAPITGVLLSICTGHTVALRTHYALFSAPFALMLIAAGAHHLLVQGRAWLVLPLLHAFAMAIGTMYVWKGTTYLGPDRCAADALRVEQVLEKERGGQYHLVHGSRGAALILGLHLRDSALDLPTIIRPIEHTTLLVRSNPRDTLIIR